MASGSERESRSPVPRPAGPAGAAHTLLICSSPHTWHPSPFCSSISSLYLQGRAVQQRYDGGRWRRVGATYAPVAMQRPGPSPRGGTGCRARWAHAVPAAQRWPRRVPAPRGLPPPHPSWWHCSTFSTSSSAQPFVRYASRTCTRHVSACQSSRHASAMRQRHTRSRQRTVPSARPAAPPRLPPPVPASTPAPAPHLCACVAALPRPRL